MSSPRVLLVRFGAIGDCVMASWAATAIRGRYPDAFLCWAIESHCMAIVDRNDLVDVVEAFPRDRRKREPRSPRTCCEQLVRYVRMRRHRFDLGIDLQGHTKTALCLRLACPKVRVALRATDAFAARLNPIEPPRPADHHTVEWYLRTLRGLGDFEMPERP
jgi:ADP-heptose:LPS heptosyltransferase